MGVERGILIAIGLSLLRHVKHSYRPHSEILTPGADGRWEPTPATPGAQTEPGLIVYRFDADLFFANADHFAEEIRTLVDRAPSRVHCVVIDAAAVTDLDYSAARTLRTLMGDLSERGIRLIFARANRFLRADLARHQIASALGNDCIFSTLHEGLQAAKGASSS